MKKNAKALFCSGELQACPFRVRLKRVYVERSIYGKDP